MEVLIKKVGENAIGFVLLQYGFGSMRVEIPKLRQHEAALQMTATLRSTSL
jgi:hypothetical protein